MYRKHQFWQVIAAKLSFEIKKINNPANYVLRKLFLYFLQVIVKEKKKIRLLSLIITTNNEIQNELFYCWLSLSPIHYITCIVVAYILDAFCILSYKL